MTRAELASKHRRILVDSVYRAFLGRLPAPDEISGPLGFLEQGKSVHDLCVMLRGSEEFAARHPEIIAPAPTPGAALGPHASVILRRMNILAPLP